MSMPYPSHIHTLLYVALRDATVYMVVHKQDLDKSDTGIN